MEVHASQANISLKDLQDELKNSPDTISLKVEHEFFSGMYWRKLYIPKGTILIGERHRERTMNMLLKGSMTIYDENSSFSIESGWYGESSKFTKKAGYAHEDSVFVNIHITNETNLEKLKETFIIEEEEYMALCNKEKVCLG